MAPEEILEYLETFRALQGQASARSRLISLKVPEDLLQAFRARCELSGIRYQTQIKTLMKAWLLGKAGRG